MLQAMIQKSIPEVESMLLQLSTINSVTPPSDTRATVERVKTWLEPLNNVQLQILSEVESTPNIVARVKGHAEGKRLLLNGHLDTFEIVSPSEWTHDPLGGEVVNRRLFGVGVSDMKAGCASLLKTLPSMNVWSTLTVWANVLPMSLRSRFTFMKKQLDCRNE